MTIITGSSTGGAPSIPFSQENTFALNQVLMFDTTLNAFVNTTLPVGGTTGEINTASNIGAGQGVFKDKLGADMRFKSIVAGTGIAVTSDADEVFIATVGAGSGDITGGTSTGSGNAIFRDKSGADLRFRSLTAGTNVTLTQNADDIVVNAGTNALTLNNIADTGYVKVANNLSDVTAATARTNLAVSSTAEADAKYLHLDTSTVPTNDATTSLGTGVKRFNEIYAVSFKGNADTATTATSLAGFTPANYVAVAGGDTMTGTLTLSGSPTNALHAATKGYVDTTIADLIDSSPGALNTLNELAAAIGDDANFSTTITNSIATKLPLAGGTLTGALVLSGAPTIALHAATKAYTDAGDALQLTAASNLSDVANAATARTNLGLGTAATTASTAYLAAGTLTTGVAEGTNKYYTDARVMAVIGGIDTDNLSEGSTNLYHTVARAKAAAVADAIANGVADVAPSQNAVFDALALKEGTLSAGTSAQYYRGDKSWQTLNTTAVAEGTNLYFTNARADARITAASLTSHTNVDSAGASEDGKVLYYNHGTTSFKWKVDDDTPAGYNNTNWDTAHGWGDHGAAGYLTSIAANSINDTHIDWGTGANQVSTADVPEQTNLYYTDARADARITNAGSANWNTAFGWGDHGTAGYLTSIAANSINDTHIDWGTGSNQVSTADIPENTNLYYTDARADARIGAASITDLSNVHTTAPTDGQILAWDNSNSRYRPITASGTGTVTSITAGTGLTGGTITASGTIAVDVGTTASKIVQLDGSARLPAVDGSQLTNVPTLTDEQVQDKVGAMFTGNTETLITATYQDSDGTIDLVVDNDLANYSNASSGFLTSIAANSINDTHIDWGTGSNQVSTADIPENTNLYYTDARADARVTAGSINNVVEDTTPQLGGTLDANGNVIDMGSNNITDAKVGQWDTAYTHSQAAHAPAGAEVNQNAFTTIAISGQTDVVADAKTDTLTLVAGSNVTLTTNAGTDTLTIAASGGGGSQNVFSTIAVSGQSDVVADATTDTLTLAAGSNMTITTNAGSDTITFAASGGGGSVDYEEFKCNYHTDGTLLAASNLSSGISGVTIDSAAGGDVTVTFTGYTTPPIGIMFYGYGYASNVYNMNTLGSTGTTLRELPGGGSSGSPTAFGSFASLKLKIRETETGASRSFGTTTHAWIRFVMGA